MGFLSVERHVLVIGLAYPNAPVFHVYQFIALLLQRNTSPVDNTTNPFFWAEYSRTLGPNKSGRVLAWHSGFGWVQWSYCVGPHLAIHLAYFNLSS